MGWALRLLPVVLALVATACGGGGGTDGKLRITVATFGEFGYEPLFAEYERLHPEIDVVGRVTDFESHHKGLITALAAGHGTADVVAVEEQYAPRIRQSKDKVADLGRFGARELRDRWARWKWEQGVDGDYVIGLGTDMGSLAMCYRRDLFERAQLPTDRDEVAALWPTWEAAPTSWCPRGGPTSARPTSWPSGWTAPERQKELFGRDGILPSQPAAYRDPAVLGHTDPYVLLARRVVGGVVAGRGQRLIRGCRSVFASRSATIRSSRCQAVRQPRRDRCARRGSDGSAAPDPLRS